MVKKIDSLQNKARICTEHTCNILFWFKMKVVNLISNLNFNVAFIIYLFKRINLHIL